MRPNYKALAMYYRRRFLEEGRVAASLELRCKMEAAVNERYLEENKRLRENVAKLEAEVWIKSQTV